MNEILLMVWDLTKAVLFTDDSKKHMKHDGNLYNSKKKKKGQTSNWTMEYVWTCNT